MWPITGNQFQVTQVSLDWPHDTENYLGAYRDELESSGSVCEEETTMKSCYHCCSPAGNHYSAAFSRIHLLLTYPERGGGNASLRECLRKENGIVRGSPVQIIPHDVKMLSQGAGRLLTWVSPSKNRSGKHCCLNLIHLTWSVFKLPT